MLDKLFVKAVKHGNAAAVREIGAADPSLVMLRDADDGTPLHYAAWKGHGEVVRVLLDLGADIDACSRDGHYGGTPLHAAAHGNQKEVAAILLERGADRSIVSCNGRTPLQETEIHKATAVAKLLREE
jgi:ankyrin repeat protein